MFQMARLILHIDMDAFFASIAQLDDPSLRDRPVLTGSDQPRAVVTTASYEARPFGCRSAMPMATAKRLCPHAIVTQVPGRRIAAMSKKLFAILRDISPLVEPVSVDEAYVDATGSERLLGEGHAIARRIKSRVREELGLVASIGVAPNKMLAKLASDMDKPDGLAIIEPDAIDEVLGPLSVGELRGIGPGAQRRLEGAGLGTVGDIRQWGEARLQSSFGEMGRHLHALAYGLDDRPVTPDHQAKSIGQERTFRENVDDPELVRQVLLSQVEHVGRRLRRHGMQAGVVTLKLRFGDFRTITRAGSLDKPGDLTADLWPTAKATFDSWAARHFEPVRLLGVTAHKLVTGSDQLTLFADEARQRQRQLDQTLDAITDRFGEVTIQRGTGVRRR